jgi:hypothetical protein
MAGSRERAAGAAVLLRAVALRLAGSLRSATGNRLVGAMTGRQDGPMIGQLHSVVIDAPDAHALARFYADLLGMEVKGDPGDDWVVVTGAGYRIAFQQAPDLRPPDWPDPERPQQFHLDIRVADIEEAEPKVLALGAKRLPGEGGDFRVYADPVGHPFCLVWGV